MIRQDGEIEEEEEEGRKKSEEDRVIEF